MSILLLSAEEVCHHLDIQVSTLGKYVKYFPNLFSGYARRSHNPRYTTEDVEVFSRIVQLGDRIFFALSTPPPGVTPTDDVGDEPQEMIPSEDLAESLINILRNLDHLRENVDTLISRVNFSLSSDSQKELDNLQSQIRNSLHRIEAEMGLSEEGAIEYRRTPSGLRWHWMESCPFFPRDIQYIKTNNPPTGYSLCSFCLSKEKAD
jgi:hypothetical protein